MKLKLIFIVLVVCSTSLSCYSQDYSTLKDIVLTGNADFTKAESNVLECSKYILSTPIEKSNLNRLYSIQFLLKWMGGTPDYSFNMDESIGELTNSTPELLGIYMACMSEYVLENKGNAKDDKAVKYNSVLRLLNYCELANNNVTLNEGLIKAIKAKSENKLKEYLKIN